MAVQLIKDDEGNPQYVVIPYNEYFQMRLKMAEYDDEKEEEWEDVPYESDEYDDIPLPDSVCDIMDKEKVSLQAAWRILRGLSQQEVADKLGISQSAVSQLEAIDSRPQKRTREKLALLEQRLSELEAGADQPVFAERGLAALRAAFAAVACVLTLAKKLFVSHRRLFGMGRADVLHVVVVIRDADHHFRRLA